MIFNVIHTYIRTQYNVYIYIYIYIHCNWFFIESCIVWWWTWYTYSHHIIFEKLELIMLNGSVSQVFAFLSLYFVSLFSHEHVWSQKIWVIISTAAVFPTHDDVIKWKHFPRYWPFVRGIHRSPMNSPHKGQWRGALMFTLICARINGWVNNREAGDLRRKRAHYDVIVMNICQR